MNSIVEIESYFTLKELDYLMPLLNKWTKNESEIVHWFNTFMIAACDNKTASELCEADKKDIFLQYIKHIEHDGFS